MVAAAVLRALLGRPLFLPLLFLLVLFLFRLGLSALDKAKAVRGDRAGGGAESKNESSSEAASAADRHVMIDPKVRCHGRVFTGRAGSKTPCAGGIGSKKSVAL